jgi:hypothetical protein
MIVPLWFVVKRIIGKLCLLKVVEEKLKASLFERR